MRASKKKKLACANGNLRGLDYHVRMGADRLEVSPSSREGSDGRFGDEGTGESRPAEPTLPAP